MIQGPENTNSRVSKYQDTTKRILDLQKQLCIWSGSSAAFPHEAR